MSTMAERARAEADRVEAEDPAPEPEPEPAPEPEPEPEPPAAVGEKALKGLEREDTRHGKAIESVLGASFADLEPCPLCAPFPSGYVPHFQLVPDEVAADMGQRAFDYFQGGDLIEPPYREARTMTRCADCDGWGQVKSGAQNQLHRVEQCPACTGNGYVPRTETNQPGYGPTAFGQPSNGPPAPQLLYTDAMGQPCAVPPDQYGQPFLHPNYAMPPQPQQATP